MNTSSNNSIKSGLNQAYIAIAISFFITGAACSTWLARIPLIQEHMHISNSLLGIAFFCLSVGSIAGMRIAGHWAVKAGSKQLIVWATAFMCLSLPLPALLSNFVLLCLTILFFGICLGTINILMNTLAVELESQIKRPIMSSMHGLHSVGTMSGAILGSLMSFVRANLLLHFSLCAVIFAATIPFSHKWLVAIAENTDQRTGTKHKSSDKTTMTPYLMTLGTIAFCSCWTEGIMADWTGVYFRSVLQTSLEEASNGFVGFCITMSLGRLIGDWLLKRWGPTLLVQGGTIIALLGIAISLISSQAWVAVAGFSLVGIGLANIVPITFRAAGNAPNSNPSESLATVAAISYFSFLVGPPIVGLVAQYWGLRIALAIAVPLLSLIAFFAKATKPVQESTS